jgi:hypothetical protein
VQEKLEKPVLLDALEIKEIIEKIDPKGIKGQSM